MSTDSCKALRKYRKDALARVPFCLTVEADALGAHIKLGNALTGPRVENYAFSSVEEMSDLQDLDITGGRIGAVLNAVGILAEAGEQVALSVECPFTIISSLIDPMIFYRDGIPALLWRSSPGSGNAGLVICSSDPSLVQPFT
jgi:uroporphyrinogen-III decarboxylase